MLKKTFWAGFLSICVWGSAWAGQDIQAYADRLIQAEQEKKDIPVFSALGFELNLDRAGLVQQSYVKKRLLSDEIAGFKAGLTGKAAQNKFKVHMPLSGVLFLSGQKGQNRPLQFPAHTRHMLETEIAFVVGEGIARRVETVAELKPMIQAIVPAIELPNLAYATLNKLQAADLIASNVGASSFILGQALKADDFDPAQLSVVLRKNGNIVNTGTGSDVLSGPWRIALGL